MSTIPQKSRKKLVLSYLQNQLELGTKTKKKTSIVKVPLTEKDTTRIKKEIGILKERI